MWQGSLRFAAVAAVLGAAVLSYAPAASADCPGGGAACPYSAAAQIGQRGGGVLRFPQAVAVGPDGSIYVGDQGSHVVQVFGPDGTFRREVGIAGTRPGELSAVGSLAVAGDGSLLVADGASNRVVRFDANGALMNSWGGPGTDVGSFHFGAGGGNSAAAGGGLAASGNVVYVSDTGNDRVQRFTIDGSHGAQIVAPGTLANPRGIAVRGSRMAVADDQHHRIVVFDTGGHILRTVGTGPGTMPGQLNFPYGVGFDPQGRLFVADDLNHRVVRYSSGPSYPYKARWGSYGTAPGQLAYPRGLAVDRGGNVYVANTGDDRIDVFDRGGRLLRSFGSSGRAAGQFDEPVGVAADASGIRAVTDAVNGRVELLNPDGSVARVWGSPNPGPTILPDPVATAFDSAGNLYVLDRRRARIVVFARATGIPARSIGTPGSGPGQLLDPSALSIDASGTISVADSGNGRIALFSTGGSYLGSFATDGTPRGVAVTADGGRTYVTDTSNRITVYDPSGVQIEQFGGTGSKLGKLNAPAQLALDTAGSIWVADRGNNRVQHFGPDGERLETLGERGTALGQFVHPTGVTVSCNGTLTVTDSDNNRVQQFALAAPPAASCVALGPLGTPPAPKVPTLPAPLGPQLSFRALRATKLFSQRTLPVRIGCDTACTVTVGGTLTQRSKPRKGHKRVTVKLGAHEVALPAGETKIVRLAVSRTSVGRLRKALRGRLGLVATIQVTATASAGQPSEITKRLQASG
ncbi:MAG: tripartite motif-containing protein 71 [Solirubrobacteraceae bacterium]